MIEVEIKLNHKPITLYTGTNYKIIFYRLRNRPKNFLKLGSEIYLFLLIGADHLLIILPFLT